MKKRKARAYTFRVLENFHYTSDSGKEIRLLEGDLFRAKCYPYHDNGMEYLELVMLPDPYIIDVKTTIYEIREGMVEFVEEDE